MGDIKAKVTVNAPKMSKYAIAGKTLTDVKKALDKREEWGSYDATKNAKSNAQTDKDKKIKSVTMTLNPVIELPNWSGYSSATKEQKASWDKMLTALEKHERNHHTIQVDGADALKKAIEAEDELDAAALNKMISDSQKETQKKQDAYDTRSGHGAKEGVELDLDA